MKPHWILEQNVFSERIYNDLVLALKVAGNTLSTVRVIPFVHEIDGKIPKIPTNTPVVVYGSIGSQVLAQKHNWIPGVWTGPHFNSANYKIRLGDLYLNSDGFVCKMSDLNKLQVPLGTETIFIRPNEDTKQFAGEVLSRSSLVEWYQKLKAIGYLDDNDFDIFVAPTKFISDEYRIVVVNGQIASWSGYKKQGRTEMYGGIPSGALKTAKLAIERYQPAPVFVIDVAKTMVDYKVIEYNTFNSAGLYACNVKSVVQRINEYLN